VSSLPVAMTATRYPKVVVDRLYCEPGYVQTHLTSLNETITILHCSCYELGLGSIPRTCNVKIGPPLEPQNLVLEPAVCLSRIIVLLTLHSRQTSCTSLQ
jgi:hypothetical protein